MGNSSEPRQNRSLTRNSYSLDFADISRLETKLLPNKPRIDSAEPDKSSFLHEAGRSASLNEGRKAQKISDPKSSQLRLNQLNRKNDKLRQELIAISEKLSGKLQKKRLPERKGDSERSAEAISLGRELEIGYKQVDRCKKRIRELRQSQVKSSEPQLTLERSIAQMDASIDHALKEIEVIKAISRHQTQMLGKEPDPEEDRTETALLKEKLRKIAQKERKQEQEEKKRHQYMLQMERRLREIRGEYLPELKSYANKNFMVQETNKHNLAQLQQQLKTLKERQKQHPIKLQRALKERRERGELREELREKIVACEGKIAQLLATREECLSSVASKVPRQIREVVAGREREGQKSFDDWLTIGTESSERVTGLKVYILQEEITGIQFVYSGQIGMRSGLSAAKQKCQSWIMHEGDGIAQLKGMLSKQGSIEWLAILSKKGQKVRFGKEIANGLTFSMEVNRGEEVRCVGGSSFWNGKLWKINRLILYIE